MKTSSQKKRIIKIFIAVLAVIFILSTALLLYLKHKANLNGEGIITYLGNNYPEIKNISKELDNITPAVVSSLNIPTLELNLSRKDISYFLDLADKYEKPEYGILYYIQNNKWRKASMVFNGETYRIKVKAHGRQPTFHRIGDYISLSVKLLDNKQINKCNKFDLIIFERIRASYALTNSMASRFNIFMLKDELVKVKINNWPEKLYFFEYPFDNVYMESIGKASLKRFGFSSTQDTTIEQDKSMVFSDGEYDSTLFKTQFQEALDDGGFTGILAAPLYERYSSLNKKIEANDYRSIADYFDLDYITSYEAVRMLFGFVAHGFLKSNFYVFYNLANGKFYPAFTRDDISSQLARKYSTIERYLNKWYPAWAEKEMNLYLFYTLAQNDLIRQEKYRKVYELIENDYAEIINEQENINSSINKLYYKGWIKEFLKSINISNEESLIKYNMNFIKEYLEKASPTISANKQSKKLILEIEPNSMSAIKFDELKLLDFDDRQENSCKLFVNCFSEIRGSVKNLYNEQHVVHFNKDTLDATQFVSHLNFFDALDDTSGRVGAKYYLTLEILADANKSILPKKIKTGMMNDITNKKISSSEMIIPVGNSTNNKKNIHIDVATEYDSNWKNITKTFHNIKYSMNGNELIILPGVYYVKDDLIIPRELKLIIKGGTKLFLGEGKSLIAYNGIDIKGEKNSPVVITSINKNKPFGTVGVVGNKYTICNIEYLDISNGSEKFIEGIYFSGGLSLHYNGTVNLMKSKIHGNKADDGVNIKNSKVIIRDNEFYDNFADQIDLDYCEGFVQNTKFLDSFEHDANGDGLDVSGSRIIVKDNTFFGFYDKGLSVGEESIVFVVNNNFQNNKLGMAIKDLSKAYLYENKFDNNEKDLTSYRKKIFFGGGEIFYLTREPLSNKIKYSIDNLSTLLPIAINNRKESFVNELANNNDSINGIFASLSKIHK